MPIHCYRRGTLILTESGEVPVEDLAIGDDVVTLSGDVKPIRWIEERDYSIQVSAGDPDALPIIVRKGALALNVPARDLWLSPEHALYLDQRLVPVRYLVNGVSIVRAEVLGETAYFHLELAEHDVIFAERAASESSVDDGASPSLNGTEYLDPDAARAPGLCFATRVEDGMEVEALRQRLLERVRPSDAGGKGAVAQLRGNLDVARHDLIEGWAFDPLAPEEPVTVVLLDNGAEIARMTANRYRSDLKEAGIGDGCHSFSFQVPGGLAEHMWHRLELYAEMDWVPLSSSPVVLKPVAVERTPSADTFGELRGNLELITYNRIGGWAQDGAHAERAVGLVVLANGQTVGRVLANRHRADLAEAGVGSGRHGFELILATPLSALEPLEIRVVREADGTDLPGSPTTLPAPDGFDAAVEAGFAGLLAHLNSDDDEKRALAFLADQMDQLLARRADRECGRAEREAHRLYRRRWGQTADVVLTASPPGPRALVIDERVPISSRDAGSVAILSHMNALSELGYEVSFAGASDMRGEGGALLPDAIRLCSAPFYSCVEEVLVREAGTFDIVYLHRIVNAERYLLLVRHYCPKARVVYGVADLHHLRLTRQAQVENRPELLGFAQATAAAEILAARRADVVITHSPAEAELLRRHVQASKVHVVPFAIEPSGPRPPLAGRNGIAFVGGFAHHPNSDAVHYMVREVLPLVWINDPKLACKIVGHGWSQERLPGADPQVSALGAVDDLDSVFDTVRLTVAPLRFGAGVKGKVLDSFAAGLPCVMTPIAAEGLPLTEPLKVLVADTPAALADRILRFHTDGPANETVGREAVRFAAQRYSPERVREALAAALGVQSAVGVPTRDGAPVRA